VSKVKPHGEEPQSGVSNHEVRDPSFEMPRKSAAPQDEVVNVALVEILTLDLPHALDIEQMRAKAPTHEFFRESR
jgi:hypothetical protein